jgi:hypothetical protein
VRGSLEHVKSALCALCRSLQDEIVERLVLVLVVRSQTWPLCHDAVLILEVTQSCHGPWRLAWLVVEQSL